MSEERMKAKRPLAITVLSLWAVIGAVLIAPTFFTPYYEQFPPWHKYAFAVIVAIGLLVSIGLWEMRRWAVMLYAIETIVGQAMALATNTWVMSGLVIPAIFLGVMAFSYRELS